MVRAALIAPIPPGLMARPEEFAAATVFLLSDEASFTTGAELFVDGGMGRSEDPIYAVYPEQRHVAVKLRAFLDYVIAFGRARALR